MYCSENLECLELVRDHKFRQVFFLDIQSCFEFGMICLEVTSVGKMNGSSIYSLYIGFSMVEMLLCPAVPEGLRTSHVAGFVFSAAVFCLS